MLTDEQMTAIVRQAKCTRCNGNGFKLVPAENHKGDRISGEFEPIECRECDGNGIHLTQCRRLAALVLT